MGGKSEPHITIEFKNIGNYVLGTGKMNFRSKIYGIDDTGGCITATEYKEPTRIALPVLTPERAIKRQNGRRFKENGEPAFTLTAQDRHGVAISVDTSTTSGGVKSR